MSLEHKNEGTFTLTELGESQRENLVNFIKENCDCQVTANAAGNAIITVSGPVSGFDSARAAITYAELEAREEATNEGAATEVPPVGRGAKEDLLRKMNSYGEVKKQEVVTPEFEYVAGEDGSPGFYRTVSGTEVVPSGNATSQAPGIGYSSTVQDADGREVSQADVRNPIMGRGVAANPELQGDADRALLLGQAQTMGTNNGVIEDAQNAQNTAAQTPASNPANSADRPEAV